MKPILVAMLMCIAIAAPAHAFSIKRFASHCTIRTVVGAPFYAVGFGVLMVTDLTVTPVIKGAKQYIYGAPIAGY